MKFFDISYDYDDGTDISDYIYNQYEDLRIADLCLMTFSVTKPLLVLQEVKIIDRILNEIIK